MVHTPKRQKQKKFRLLQAAHQQIQQLVYYQNFQNKLTLKNFINYYKNKSRMSKRTTEETTTTEFSFDNSNGQLKKKIKLLNDNIIERIKETDDEIDINEHEVHKFLLIIHSLFKKVTSEETFEEIDSILNDTILVVCNIIAGLLKNNIDSLKLPAILKTAFKIFKNLFVGVKRSKKWRKRVERTRSKRKCLEFITGQGDQWSQQGGKRRTTTGFE